MKHFLSNKLGYVATAGVSIVLSVALMSAVVWHENSGLKTHVHEQDLELVDALFGDYDPELKKLEGKLVELEQALQQTCLMFADSIEQKAVLRRWCYTLSP